MVGYLLGLGDRHPSNLMVDRYSGKVLHIDFGDCFEASMYREKFPEKVPFRLTRMLVRAMEVSGIEGNFRSTCESVDDRCLRLQQGLRHGNVGGLRARSAHQLAFADEPCSRARRRIDEYISARRANKPG